MRVLEERLGALESEAARIMERVNLDNERLNRISLKAQALQTAIDILAEKNTVFEVLEHE